jgi:hypothetical protein
MLRKLNKETQIFFVTCANWESVVAASDESDAAAISIEKASLEYGKDLNLSPTLCVMNISKSFKEVKFLDDTYTFLTPDVLADAGMHDLSKKYSKIIDLMD